MNENSIWYLFDPNSPGWIRRRLETGEYVSGEDVARVARLHPDCMTDPVILGHSIRLHERKVKKPKGRKKETLGRRALICVAGMLAREQITEWKQETGDVCPRKGRSELSRSEAAYSRFGEPLGLSGRAFANAVSSLKRNPLFGE